MKVSGGAAPDLSFEAHPFAPRGWWKTAIVGDVVKAPGAGFTARVTGGSGRQLLIVKNGVTVKTVPGDERRLRLSLQPAAAPGTGASSSMNGSLVETVSSPIWVEPGNGHGRAGALR